MVELKETSNKVHLSDLTCDCCKKWARDKGYDLFKDEEYLEREYEDRDENE